MSKQERLKKNLEMDFNAGTMKLFCIDDSTPRKDVNETNWVKECALYDVEEMGVMTRGDRMPVLMAVVSRNGTTITPPTKVPAVRLNRFVPCFIGNN